VCGYQPILIKKKSALFSSINSIVADVCLSVTSWTILTIEAKALIELEYLNSKFELELATPCSLYWCIVDRRRMLIVSIHWLWYSVSSEAC
jgi:hypothetical protein